LQNKAARALTDKYSNYQIIGLFELSFTKFMYSFDNCGLPEHFDIYFLKIASVYNYLNKACFTKIPFILNEHISESAFFNRYSSQSVL